MFTNLQTASSMCRDEIVSEISIGRSAPNWRECHHSAGKLSWDVSINKIDSGESETPLASIVRPWSLADLSPVSARGFKYLWTIDIKRPGSQIEMKSARNCERFYKEPAWR